MVGGLHGSASLYGQVAQASGAFAATGDAQRSEFVLRGVANSGGTTHLGMGIFSNHRVTIAPDRAMTAHILVVARNQAGDYHGSEIRCVVSREGNVTAGGCTPATITASGALLSNFAVNAAVDDGLDALLISATNNTGATVRVVATVTAVEVSFP